MCTRLIFNLSAIFVILFTASAVRYAHAEAFVTHDSRTIIINQAQDIVLPENAASVLLGSADIVEIMAQSGRHIVVAGKRIGTTNLIIRDSDNMILADIIVTVKPVDMRQISVYRGMLRVDYACVSNCQIQSQPQSQSQDAGIDGRVTTGSDAKPEIAR